MDECEAANPCPSPVEWSVSEMAFERETVYETRLRTNALSAEAEAEAAEPELSNLARLVVQWPQDDMTPLMCKSDC